MSLIPCFYIFDLGLFYIFSDWPICALLKKWRNVLGFGAFSPHWDPEFNYRNHYNPSHTQTSGWTPYMPIF